MAQAIAIGFTSLILTKMYNVSLLFEIKASALADTITGIDRGDGDTGAWRCKHSVWPGVPYTRSSEHASHQPNLKDVLNKLKETHSTSAGLKVSQTWKASVSAN
jgi:hypothetical protein